jgi:hypothetical protein
MAVLESFVHALSIRVGRYLEHQYLLVQDMEISHLALGPCDETGMEPARAIPSSKTSCNEAILISSTQGERYHGTSIT